MSPVETSGGLWAVGREGETSRARSCSGGERGTPTERNSCSVPLHYRRGSSESPSRSLFAAKFREEKGGTKGCSIIFKCEKLLSFISTTCITSNGRGQFEPRPGLIKTGVVYFSHALSNLQRSKMATKGKRKVYVVGVGMTKVRQRIMVAFWPPTICLPSLRSLDGGMTLITRTWQRKQVS